MKSRHRWTEGFVRLPWPVRGLLLSGFMLGACGLVIGIGLASGRVSSDTSGLVPGVLGVVAVGFGASWFTRPKL